MLVLAGSAGRWPASAPPGAGSRGCGPAARAPRVVPYEKGTRRSPARGREGTRRGVGPCRERGPLARIRAARRASPGMRAGGPRSQGRSMREGNPAVAGPRPRRNKARCWSLPGARAAGPHPRRRARAPGDAGRRPALPGSFHARREPGGRRPAAAKEQGAVLVLAGSAGRWPASAPPGAPPRGCGPAARAPRVVPCEKGTRRSPARGREGTRRGVGPCGERGPLARIRAARRASPGMRAGGPRSQGRSMREGNPAVAGPRTRRNKARCWSLPGARAAGPHPRRPARLPGDAGRRPALPGSFHARREPGGRWPAAAKEQGAVLVLAGSAGRWPASAPPGAPPRGCGPAARARGFTRGLAVARASISGDRIHGEVARRPSLLQPRRDDASWRTFRCLHPRLKPFGLWGADA